MTRYDRRHWGLAMLLAMLAGFIDAIGFIKTGGLFVSFMSGNSTRLAVGAAAGSDIAILCFMLIAAFVGGVMAGAFVRAAAPRAPKSAVLLLVALFLAGAALLDGRLELAPVLILAAAMGAENSVFQREGEVSVGVTYMTGTLVKLGQRLAGALMGGPRWAWAPYLMLWAGLVAGALAGAVLYTDYGTPNLWIAAAAALGLAGLAARIQRRSERAGD